MESILQKIFERSRQGKIVMFKRASFFWFKIALILGALSILFNHSIWVKFPQGLLVAIVIALIAAFLTQNGFAPSMEKYFKNKKKLQKFLEVQEKFLEQKIEKNTKENFQLKGKLKEIERIKLDFI